MHSITSSKTSSGDTESRITSSWWEIAGFCLLAYAFSWGIWLAFFPLDLEPPLEHISGTHIRAISIMLIGAIGPSFAAIVITFISQGWFGVSKLFARFRPQRTHIGWFIFALAAFPIADVGMRLVYASINPDGIEQNWTQASMLLITIPFSAVSGALMEELGWRGYLQPVLLGKVGIVGTGVIIGVIWTFWHTPLFFAQFGFFLSGYEVTGFGLSAAVVFLVSISTLMAWMGSHNESNVFLSYVFHFSTNTAVGSLLLVANSSLVQSQLLLLVAGGLACVGIVCVGIRVAVRNYMRPSKSLESDI